jgi:hypothetical protein
MKRLAGSELARHETQLNKRSNTVFQQALFVVTLVHIVRTSLVQAVTVLINAVTANFRGLWVDSGIFIVAVIRCANVALRRSAGFDPRVRVTKPISIGVGIVSVQDVFVDFAVSIIVNLVTDFLRVANNIAILISGESFIDSAIAVIIDAVTNFSCLRKNGTVRVIAV